MGKEVEKVDAADVEAPEPVQKALVIDDVMDDYAQDVFLAMGHTKPFSHSLMTAYSVAKRRKDIVHPGRMSVETMAVISLVSSMSDGDVSLEG